MRRPDNKGFTLLEVMVALAVMGILLVGLLQTLNYHLDVASQHEARTVTMQLASQKLSETREDPVASEGDFEEPYQDYHFKAELGESKYPGVGYIAVTVTGHNEQAVLRELFRIRQNNLTGEDEGASSQATDDVTGGNAISNAVGTGAK
jgi:prepilin-type N-terminal cleavage/methylation domain-containing protein